MKELGRNAQLPCMSLGGGIFLPVLDIRKGVVITWSVFNHFRLLHFKLL